MSYQPQNLPPKFDLETKVILKRLPAAHAALAELKGVSATIPNVSILLNTLALQEAKDSSAVENIITTHDELFRAELNMEMIKNIAAKEVQHYAMALKKGFALVKENHLITTPIILSIHEELEQNNAGYRVLPGTELKNDRTNQTVYIPPQDGDDVKLLMDNLITYINDDQFHPIDPLIRMAVIHHQFESIHPFYDGNGRAGRIINILYLVSKGLLDIPILYLSRYIIQNKSEYYRLLQKVREDNDWESWILFILDGVETVSRQCICLIKEIKTIMQDYKHHIRSNYKFYSQDLINNLFRHPYTKIEFIENDLRVERRTAAKYLNELAADSKGMLQKIKIKKCNYYINIRLVDLFLNQDYNVHRNDQ